MPLQEEEQRTGSLVCAHCNRAFEATAFAAPQHTVAPTAEVVTIGPEGANACANHTRNAAVTSCQRCGLFICSLCEMNLGTGSYCPSCFDRMRTEGSLQTGVRKYRDYAGMSLSAVIFGLLLWFPFGIVIGPLAVHYALKGRKQRREEQRSVVGVTILMVLGILEVAGWMAMVGFIIYRAAQ
ncbi:MAG TPA: hypothetical protein VEK57_02105 [Thermoanaerobaculia bacterium]|nr:hypothetical protein [Thermoanaerobaculia bacterium]